MASGEEIDVCEVTSFGEASDVVSRLEAAHIMWSDRGDADYSAPNWFARRGVSIKVLEHYESCEVRVDALGVTFELIDEGWFRVV